MSGKKKWIAVLELSAVLLITDIAFVWGICTALAERGYTACGGEYLLLLIPVIYYTGKRVLKDWIAELREMRRK